MIKITSFTIFGIKTDNNQTSPYNVDRDKLDIMIEGLIADRRVSSVVIKKNFIPGR